MTAFDEGKAARLAGKPISAMPYIARFTKLGTPVPTEQGEEWINGYQSVPRVASAKEVAEANELTDISRFRRRSNRYYR